MNPATSLLKRHGDIAVRTARCNEIIRREPREIPRRLRGLLLAIDGRQPVSTYLDKLDGFGNVEGLIAELAALGLIEFKSPRRRRRREPDSGIGGQGNSTFGSDSNFGSDSMLESNFGSESTLGSDSNFGPDSLLQAERGGSSGRTGHPNVPRHYETFSPTMPGGFDDLVRDAALRFPGFQSPAAQPLACAASMAAAPGNQTDVQRQVDSLFLLLETVRGERRELRTRVNQLKKHRQAAESLRVQNRRLLIGLVVSGGACVLLAVLHLLRS